MTENDIICLDPNLGQLLFRWAMLRNATEKYPSDPVLAEHLEACASCNRHARNWMRQVEASHLMTRARRLVSCDVNAEVYVDEKRSTGGERILFESSMDDKSRGLLVRVGSDGEIASVEVADRDTFNKLSQ